MINNNLKSENALNLTIIFDPEANVYIATSPDVRGLVLEAATLDEIYRQAEIAIPELLRLNGA